MRDSLAAAARVVARVLGGGSLQDALGKVLAKQPQLRPAVQDLSYAACRQLPALHHLVDALASRPLQDAPLHALLLVALQQLRQAQSKPFVVVDQSVEAATRLHLSSARRLVNALLRQYLRQADALESTIAADPVLRFGYPAWWVAHLQRAYPGHWQELLAAGNQHPPLTLRVNQRRSDVATYLQHCAAAGVAARALGECAVQIAPLAVERIPGFRDGWVSVQDWAAQQAALLLQPQDGQRVLDACAAPGGKTAHLLERARLDLLALDHDPRRLPRITENLQRLGLSATVRQGDAADPQWWDGRAFDLILADVPCTGSGVVRRRPDIKWLRTEHDLQQSVALQRRILAALWRCLKPGGKLLYVTCSVFPEENDLQIKQFLETHDDAERLPLAQPGLGDGQWLPTPEHDGFFFALLARRV